MGVGGNCGNFASSNVGYRKPHSHVLSQPLQGGFSNEFPAGGDLRGVLRKRKAPPAWEQVSQCHMDLAIKPLQVLLITAGFAVSEEADVFPQATI